MKNKIILIILIVLFIISSSCSVIGIIEHNKDKKAPQAQKETQKITYEYYIDEILVEEMPPSDIDDDGNNLYKYVKSSCTGEFDTEKWKFNPSNKTNGVCKLYFVKTYYDVDITATNGSVDEENESKIARENDGQFKVTPNEGYVFKEVNCSNNKKATYDKSTNTLSINVITEDIACKIDFEIKSLKMDLVVKNGNGNTTEEVNYGQSVSVLVQPKDGYEKPTVTCTNNQEAFIKDGTLTIQKLTKDTQCTATYSKIPIVKYKLILKLPEHATLISGNLEQTIVAGKDANFSVKPDEGYELEVDCGGPRPEIETLEDGTINYTLLQMSKNLTCTLTSKEKIQEDESNTGE